MMGDPFNPRRFLYESHSYSQSDRMSYVVSTLRSEGLNVLTVPVETRDPPP